MKKNLKIILSLIIITLTLSACGVKNADKIINDMAKKQEKCSSYYVEGTMEIINNEDTYTYNVTVSYQKGDYYKINLVNNLNNHEQVILRNDEGVYVVTPSLNKSFKFQSDWPYNNSQVYLMGSIIEDLKEDEDRTFKTNNDGYYFQSSVNYPNNKSLTKQNVYINKKNQITKVEVTNNEGKVQITMKFNKINYNKKFASDYFELSKLINITKDETKKDQNSTTNNTKDTKTQEENNSTNNANNNTNNNTNSTDNNSNANSNNETNTTEQNSQNNNGQTSNDTTTSKNSNTTNQKNNTSNNTNTNTNTNTNENVQKSKQTATIDDVIYPMYLPDNTTLANKEVVNTDNGQRLILTFEGDNPFVLVEETIGYQDEGLIIPVSGNLDFLTDVVGVVNDNSANWDSNGIEYYIVSNTLKTDELLTIARSISVLPVSK